MKVTDLKKDEGIHCQTEAEAIAICQLMHDAGLKWCYGDSYIKYTTRDVHESDTVYYPEEGSYGDIAYANDLGYKTYPASDFLFTEGEEVEVSDDGDDRMPRIYLTTINPTIRPIVCVLQRHEEQYKRGEKVDTCYRKYIRKLQPKIKEISIAGLEKQYGCKVKIVK